VERFADLRWWNGTIDEAKLVFRIERDHHGTTPSAVIAFTK
jgi:hypothetical protein